MDYLPGDSEILLKRRLPLHPGGSAIAGDIGEQEKSMSTGNLELGAFDRALQKSLNAAAKPALEDFARRVIAVTALHWFANTRPQ